MTRIFYDTEFLEDGKTIELISIGMVRESDGAELYLVNSEMPVYRIRQHPWLSKNVWPSLPLDSEGHLDFESPLVVSRAEIAFAVRRFVCDRPFASLWAWYGAYDHVCLAQLFGPMVSLPNGIPMWTNDIRQEMARLGDPRMPEQESGVHNALSDARHNLVRMQFLGEDRENRDA